MFFDILNRTSFITTSISTLSLFHQYKSWFAFRPLHDLWEFQSILIFLPVIEKWLPEIYSSPPNRGAVATIRAAIALIAPRSRLSRRDHDYRGNRCAIALTYNRVAHDRVAVATNRDAIATVAARSRHSRRDRGKIFTRDKLLFLGSQPGPGK